MSGEATVAEVDLNGPGSMMAQGNYWGDLLPVDNEGDILGECSRFEWPDLDRAVLIVKNARCELWNVDGQGNPKGIDGRFQLTEIPDR